MAHIHETRSRSELHFAAILIFLNHLFDPGLAANFTTTEATFGFSTTSPVQSNSSSFSFQSPATTPSTVDDEPIFPLPSAPQGFELRFDGGFDRIIMLKWQVDPIALYWNIERNCSSEPIRTASIRTMEPLLVDYQVHPPGSTLSLHSARMYLTKVHPRAASAARVGRDVRIPRAGVLHRRVWPILRQPVPRPSFVLAPGSPSPPLPSLAWDYHPWRAVCR
jgi:hypothetical protein